MSSKTSISLCCVFLSLASLSGRAARGQVSETGPPASHRVKVSEVVASSLIAQKTPMKYPDAARNSGVQGTVVLNVVVSETGDVKNVTVVSGDPLLAQAAADAVKQWKYKPYTVDGVPMEIETQVSVNFHLKSSQHTAPSLGTFKGGVYSNVFFDFEYPLSRDWVLETQAMQKKVSAVGQSPGMYVLLASVHIPQQTAPLEADSFFVLSAFDGAGHNCEQYLQGLADMFHSRKEAKLKGSITPATITGRDFYRADFDFAESPNHRTFLCTQSKNFLLQWNIVGLSKGAVESTISTLNALHSPQSPTLTPAVPSQNAASSSAIAATQSKPQVDRVRVAAGVSQGLILKKVEPVYPQQAKYARIQGAVVMSAIINKNGDIVDLEVLEGPIELVVSAVNAVRQRKYRPYVLNGEPVEVMTQITVKYTLGV